MSKKKENQLTLEVRRIRSSARAGFIDDYATCKPTLAGYWPFVGADQAVAEDTAANRGPVVTK